MLGECHQDATIDSSKSAVIGALLSVSTGFSLGAIVGFASHRIDGLLREAHNYVLHGTLSINETNLSLLISELTKGNSDIQQSYESALLWKVLDSSPRTINTTHTVLDNTVQLLSDEMKILNRKPRLLDEKVNLFMFKDLPKVIQLNTDPIILCDIYKEITFEQSG